MKTFKTKLGTELPILDLRGKDYVQVAYRLVWFREERPEWGIETEIVVHDEKRSVVRATIKDEKGRIIAQATKQEDAAGFKDHLEKSETGSIGRALALVGFGTQFAPDFDEGERMVDAPLGQMRPADNKDNLIMLHNPGLYVIRCGKKFAGMSLEKIGAHDAGNYANWLKDEAQKKNKPLTGDFKEAVEMIDIFVKSRESN